MRIAVSRRLSTKIEHAEHSFLLVAPRIGEYIRGRLDGLNLAETQAGMRLAHLEKRSRKLQHRRLIPFLLRNGAGPVRRPEWQPGLARTEAEVRRMRVPG